LPFTLSRHTTKLTLDYSALESIPKSCLETGELPSADALKERLRFMALVQGLDPNISDDVIGFVSQAVEV
jgi:hypothetical protein